ncbi:hypothetical protein TSAR_003138 [Trichomalopsis sarcophagae]|uniref:MD-2-related lipid-recognition domain-containing protein n=1 Tax=Trichomalopsis sarcophagae TaxID=543379 RepID=A0A232EM91_9HYME|nr:hypothetical protein TSAR_003138 [Trichomalopsis sarcophagae]
MKLITGYIIAAFLVAFSTQSTPVQNCKDAPAPKDVRFDGCSEPPCLLVRGTNATAEWDFSIPEDTNVLKPRVLATYLGETVLYPFPQENACDTLKNAKCPLKSGQDVTYQLSMPILEYYPRIPVSVEFAFLDDKDKLILCFAFSAKVVDQ